MSITLRPLSGAELLAAIDDLARLRITVFAAFPYLYDGDLGYEIAYLRETELARLARTARIGRHTPDRSGQPATSSLSGIAPSASLTGSGLTPASISLRPCT